MCKGPERKGKVRTITKKKYNKKPVNLQGVRQGEEAYVRVVETDRWGMTQQGHAGYGQKQHVYLYAMGMTKSDLF